MFGKNNWVCTTCGQHFTRRSSGNRHNSNLHSRSAKLVRPFDYIIGRLNGEIAPPIHDPLLYRRRKSDINNSNKFSNRYTKFGYNRSFMGRDDLDRDNNIHSVIHEINISEQHEQRRKHQTMTNNNINNKYGMPQVSRLSNKSSKFEELKRLLSKYDHPDDAYKILTVVNCQLVIDGKKDFLDATLPQLRDLDSFRCGDYSP